MDVSTALGAFTKPVGLDGPKVHHIPQWGEFGDPKRMDVISRIAKMRGRDPRIASLAVGILKEAGVQPRDYEGQAAALLNFVQHKLYYVNEPGERLQDPTYTLKVGYGDCDDLVIVLAALLESIRLPWKVVISGNKGRKKVRYHQGDKFPGGESKGYNWSHIYLMIGNRPFTPSKWSYAETTVRGAPLGWDVVEGDASMFPELHNYGAIMGYELLEYGAMQMPVTNKGPQYNKSVNLPVNLPSQAPPSGDSIAGVTTLDPSRLVGITQVNQLAPVISKGLIKDPARSLLPRVSGRPVSARRANQKADMVAVVVIGPNGKVLALHRSSAAKWMPGRWDLPGGKTGGRNPRLMAANILCRETGIRVKPSQLRPCSAVYHPSAGTSMFYSYRIPRGAKRPLIQVAAKEHQGWRFVSRAALSKELRTAPYVNVAFRACFKPKSLNPYTKGPRWKGLNNPNYGAFEMPPALQKEYGGFPLWGILLAGGAGYYFLVHKKK